MSDGGPHTRLLAGLLGTNELLRTVKIPDVSENASGFTPALTLNLLSY